MKRDGPLAEKLDEAASRGSGVPAAVDQAVALPEQNGIRYVGQHLLIDLIEGHRLDEVDFVRQVMLDCVAAAGAVRVSDYFFQFPLTGGVSGVVILAESHASIHSWPELGYAAVDLFTCGQANPQLALAVLKDKFAPADLVMVQSFRGLGAVEQRLPR